MLNLNTLNIFVYCLTLLVILLAVVVGVYHTNKPLPEGLSFEGEKWSARQIDFLRDLTWIDEHGQRHCEQQIFDAVFEMIRSSRRFILIDMFLFNNFTGKDTSSYRLIGDELASLLVKQKQNYPEIRIVFVTDPVNTVYGGLANQYLDRLQISGIEVIETKLDDLRDSNIFYSPLWRIVASWFGNGSGSIMPNPFGSGRVSIRSYLRMLNFKANHRKVIIADSVHGYTALVTSANPHDGSSAHGNVAVRFTGMAALDLLNSEESVPGFTGKLISDFPETLRSQAGKTTVQILTEGKIKNILLDELLKTGKGDKIDIVMFYLSDRDVIHALKKLHDQGVKVRILLDPNKDAFGRTKGGMPNRQVAAELVGAGVEVRWAVTNGEQMHSKMVIIHRQQEKHFMLLGSANLTRRNLDDFNLETDVAIRGDGQEKVFTGARSYFNLLWMNPDQRRFSTDHEVFAVQSALRTFIYRILELSGMCTF